MKDGSLAFLKAELETTREEMAMSAAELQSQTVALEKELNRSRARIAELALQSEASKREIERLRKELAESRPIASGLAVVAANPLPSKVCLACLNVAALFRLHLSRFVRRIGALR